MDEFLLPGYEIEELLGFGGSGEVWRARESATGDLVALKRLRGTSSTDPVAVQRLRREAALLATIRHDHIVALRSVVPTVDGLVLVLEYAAGGSLTAVLAARSRLSAGEVVTIGAPLAQALGDAHARGLVHGDVTPGNVVFDGSGKPLLADLGVASLAGDRAGPVAGTLGYADPSGVASPASDVHGLAAVCFTALAGVTPYREGEVAAQPLRSLAPGAPAALIAAITAGLDPDPAGRPDANAFARSLFAACSPVAVRLVRVGQPVVAAQTRDVLGGNHSVPSGPGSKAGEPPPGRHRWSTPRPVVVRRAVTVACAVALLGAAVAAGVGWAWAGDSHRASATPDVGVAELAGVNPAPAPVSSASAVPVSAIPSLAAAPTDWTGVLGALDSTRDDAFADARADELEAVYVPGSGALAADLDTLSQLVRAGEHARGLRLQLVSVRALSLSPGEVTLAVSDTLGTYDVVGPSGTSTAVAGRGLRTWTVVLRAQPTGPWRIASVSAT